MDFSKNGIFRTPFSPYRALSLIYLTKCYLQPGEFFHSFLLPPLPLAQTLVSFWVFLSSCFSTPRITDALRKSLLRISAPSSRQ